MARRCAWGLENGRVGAHSWQVATGGWAGVHQWVRLCRWEAVPVWHTHTEAHTHTPLMVAARARVDTPLCRCAQTLNGTRTEQLSNYRVG